MRVGIRVGVDVGTVRVGVAVSDPQGILATPRDTLRRDPEHDTDLDVLSSVVRELEAVEVVVGLPRHLSGEESPSATTARRYASMLAVRISPVPVRLVDERLTTVDAHRSLRASGVPGRQQRAVVDQAAAVLILQAALDTERTTELPPGERVRPGRRKARTKDGRL